jgi:hypothetical protein
VRRSEGVRIARDDVLPHAADEYTRIRIMRGDGLRLIVLAKSSSRGPMSRNPVSSHSTICLDQAVKALLDRDHRYDARSLGRRYLDLIPGQATENG